MAWQQSDIDALKRAMAAAGPASEVEYADGTRTRFMTPRQARDLLGMMEQDVATACGKPRVRQIRVNYRSGL